MDAKIFFKKLKAFTKRNFPAMAVSFCLIFALSLVTAVAVLRVQENRQNQSLPTNSTPEQVEPDVPTNVDTVISFVMPVEGATEGLPFAQDYLVKYETLKKWQTHEAIDFIAMAGTKVVSAYDGKVESVYNDSLEGNVVVIDHGNNLKTVYKSLSSDILVEQGQEIKTGEQIGFVSNSASFEEWLGAHLHFEVIQNGEYKNPYDFLPSTNK